MNKCSNCGHLFEDGEEMNWQERHGFIDGLGEQFSGCPLCGEGYVEVEACTICGEYPEDKYEDGELRRGGICQECFNDGIRAHFMEYFNSEINKDDQIEFYCGKIYNGYIYTSDEVLHILNNYYSEYVKSRYFDLTKDVKVWVQFIEDGDPDHFSAWLIKKQKKESE